MGRVEDFLSTFKEVPPKPAPFREPSTWTMKTGWQGDNQGTLFAAASEKTIKDRRNREYGRVNRETNRREAVIRSVPFASISETGSQKSSEFRRPEPENVKMTATKSGDPLATVVYPENGRVAAFQGGRQVGAISLSEERGRKYVSTVGVAPDARRQGIATALWGHAQETFGDLRHDVPVNRTLEGHKWSKAVGGKDWKNHRADSPRPRDAY